MLTKREKKEIGEMLAECVDDAGFDQLVEIYNCGADWMPRAVQLALHTNTELGEEVEEFMWADLAKKYSKRAGGKFVKNR